MLPMPRALLTVCVLLAAARGQDAPVPKFEVATIRLCDSDGGGRSGGGTSSPGRLVLKCQTLGDADRSFPGLIAQAYGLFANGHRNPPWALLPVEGGPAWLKSERYEIVAKAEGDASYRPDERTCMLQALLEDRFKLKIHHETREIPVYALTVLAMAERSCIRFKRVAARTVEAAWNHQEDRTSSCTAKEQTLGEIAKNLGIGLDRPVIDKTRPRWKV